MSTIAGVLSETLLRSYRIMADKLLVDVNLKNDVIPYVDSLDALLKNSVPKFNEFRIRNNKTFAIEAMWPNFCELVVADNEGCVFDGPKPSTNVQDYELTYEKVVNFSVDESDFIDNEFGFAEMVARGRLVAIKNLVEDFNAYAIGVINTLGGPNNLTGIYTVNGDLTYIPATNWNANTIAYLLRTARYNKMKNVFGLSGGNLLQQWLLAAELMAANPENVAGQVFSKFPMFFDELNIDTVNAAIGKLTYLIDKGSYGIANKAWNDNTKKEITGDIFAFSEKVEGLDLFVDVYMERVCSNDMQKLNVKTKLTADLFGAPTPCDGTTTGILKFICGEYSA